MNSLITLIGKQLDDDQLDQVDGGIFFPLPFPCPPLPFPFPDPFPFPPEGPGIPFVR